MKPTELTQDDLFEGAADCGCTHGTPGNAYGRVAEGMAGEPLIAVAEGSSVEMYGCGPCGDATTPGTSAIPKTLRFEKMTRTAQGMAYETHDSEIGQPLQKLWEDTGASAHAKKRSCLPWVRVVRDTAAFRACMTKADAIGPLLRASQFYKMLRDAEPTPEELKEGKRRPGILQEDQEIFLVASIDTQNRLRGLTEIARGARDRVETPIPDLLRIPLIEGAMGIVVIHNHPSGRVNPSESDKQLTVTIDKGCKTVGIALLDHIIVGPVNANGSDNFFSFLNAGLIKMR